MPHIHELDTDLDSGLDLDSKDAMLTELGSIINDTTPYGLRSPDSGDRLIALARISFLASRISWLEAVPISMEQLDARYSTSVAKWLAEPGKSCECGVPRKRTFDDEHGCRELCTNPDCPTDK